MLTLHDYSHPLLNNQRSDSRIPRHSFAYPLNALERENRNKSLVICKLVAGYSRIKPNQTCKYPSFFVFFFLAQSITVGFARLIFTFLIQISALS